MKMKDLTPKKNVTLNSSPGDNVRVLPAVQDSTVLCGVFVETYDGELRQNRPVDGAVAKTAEAA